jgi:hypothetical protein
MPDLQTHPARRGKKKEWGHVYLFAARQAKVKMTKTLTANK